MKSVLKEECIFFRSLIGLSETGDLEKKIIPLADSLIKTYPVKMLKGRKQLGFLDIIKNDWRKASHSRFDHTVGVMAKCIVAADIINKNTKENKSDLSLGLLDVAELVAAASIHDSGHLPFSHVTERAIMAHHGDQFGARHEERVVPMLLHGHEFFADYVEALRQWNLWESDDKFNGSIYRIAYLIDAKTTIRECSDNNYRIPNGQFPHPKTAVMQLLSSELDMDRLDYLIRDSINLDYRPVLSLKDYIATFLNGIFLHKSESFGEGNPIDNLELCIKKDFLENVFFMLVGRVLLYKYRYFDREVRRFEGALTYLVSELLGCKASIQTIQLMQLSDSDFLNRELEKIIKNTYFEDKGIKDSLLRLLNDIKGGHSRRYEYVGSIDRDQIQNPRLKEEFSEKAWSFSYVKQLQKWLALKSGVDEHCLLLDAFTLKPGEGKFLVFDQEKDEISLLKNFMNGSNLHRLCSQLSLDVYVHSEQSTEVRERLKAHIGSFGELQVKD